MLSISDIDIAILRLIHENRALWLDGFFYSLSFTTTLVSVGILLTVFYCSLRSNPQLRAAGAKMAATFMLAIAVSFALKVSIQRNRPFVTYPEIQKLSEAGSASFPSGHTTEAFALAFAALFFLPEKMLAAPVFIWACLVAYSRMALGVHYPSDILAGLVTGLLAGFTVQQADKFVLIWKKKTT